MSNTTFKELFESSLAETANEKDTAINQMKFLMAKTIKGSDFSREDMNNTLERLGQLASKIAKEAEETAISKVQAYPTLVNIKTLITLVEERTSTEVNEHRDRQEEHYY